MHNLQGAYSTCQQSSDEAASREAKGSKSQHPVLPQMRDNDGTDVAGHDKKGYVAQGSKSVICCFNNMVHRHTWQMQSG